MKSIDAFLDKYAREPELLRERLATVAQRKRRLRDNEMLCREGDKAECFWIIDEGIIVVGDGQKITRRTSGELVGEIAFHRLEKGYRTATMKADGVTTVWEIDRSVLTSFTPEQRAAWYETIAAVLAEKVFQATVQRARLLNDNLSLDYVLRRFVCDDGLMAVNGAFETVDVMNIQPDQTVALLWFSDVAGFSSYSRNMDAAEAARQMRRFMDIQVEEIHAASGEVDKFMGDGLMAFWRVPDQDRIRDRVSRATRAALNSIKRIREIIEAEKLPLDIRIGLHRGPVVIGDFGGTGRIAYTVMGETVNSASRFEQARVDINDNALGALRLSEAVFKDLRDQDLLAQIKAEPQQFRAKAGRDFTTYTSII